MKHPRELAWRRASHRVLTLEPHAKWPIVALGKLDAQIHEANSVLKDLRDRFGSASPEEMDLLHETVALTHFWALGAYEVARTLDARYRTSRQIPYGTPTPFTAVKLKLERVRMPLAKQEPASRHIETDYPFGNSALSTGGLGWKPSPDDLILWEELSNELLQTVSELDATGSGSSGGGA